MLNGYADNIVNHTIDLDLLKAKSLNKCLKMSKIKFPFNFLTSKLRKITRLDLSLMLLVAKFANTK